MKKLILLLFIPLVSFGQELIRENVTDKLDISRLEKGIHT